MENYKIPEKQLSDYFSCLFYYRVFLFLLRNLFTIFAILFRTAIYPFFLFYDCIKNLFKHTRPADRFGLNLRAALASLHHQRLFMVDVYQGELLDFNIACSEIYDCRNGLVIIWLRILLEINLLIMPLLAWINLAIFYIKNLFFKELDSRFIFISRGIFYLICFLQLIIDSGLFILIMSRKDKLKNTSPLSDLAIAAKREIRKRKAHFYSDIFFMLVALPIIYLIYTTLNNVEHLKSIFFILAPFIINSVLIFTMSEITTKLKGKYTH